MTGIDDLVAELARLTREDLNRWIAEDLVRPERQEHTFIFAEVDVARVRLIYELHYDFEVPEAALPVVLDLLDRLYAARTDLHRLADAVNREPDDVRRRIAAALRDSS